MGLTVQEWGSGAVTMAIEPDFDMFLNPGRHSVAGCGGTRSRGAPEGAFYSPDCG
jgi:hypothetical protein